MGRFAAAVLALVHALGVASRAPEPSPAARALRHYLQARLALDDDDLDTAAVELQTALRLDPGAPELHAALGQVWLRAGRAAEAEAELRKAVAAQPGHVEARLGLARLQLSRNRFDEARAELRAALAAHPGEPEPLLELVRVELAAGAPDAAEAAALRLARAAREGQDEADRRERSAPGGPPEALVRADRQRAAAVAGWLEVARLRAERREDARAAAAFGQARAIDGSALEPIAEEAAFDESRGDLAAARKLQLELLARTPDDPDAVGALARLALFDADLREAAARATRLRALAGDLEPWAPSDDDAADEGPSPADRRVQTAAALLRLSLHLLGARRSADGLALAAAGLRLLPGQLELELHRGVALAQLGRAREGAEALEAVLGRLAEGEEPAPELLGLDIESLRAEARVQLALARSRLGDHGAALRLLRSALEEQPEDEETALAFVDASDRAGRLPEARDLLARALRTHPATPSLQFAFATAQDRSGDPAGAARTLDALLEKTPDHAGALNALAYPLVERGESAGLARAAGLLERAVRLRPDDPAIADSWGACLVKLGRPGEALPFLRRAAVLSPGDPVVLSHLGDAQLALGRRADARASFRGALQLVSLGPRARRPRAEPLAPDPPDRPAERDEGRVRRELLQKLRALAP